MTVAQDITRAYNGEWHGSYGNIPTPGHGPKDRGTKVQDAPGAPDGLLVHSFNGGDPLAIKDDFRARGLLPERGGGGDQSKREGAHFFARTRSKDGWKETAHFDYFDADGALAYQVVRREKTGERKRFVARRPDENGGWIEGMGDTPRILYRLPELRKAISPAVLRDEPLPLVYLTEGERKADKLASWGLLATSCPFGANSWRDTYAADLASCTVAILPDNDKPGHGFATRAAASIDAAGGKAIIVDLPGLSDGQDIMDWNGSREELETLVAAAINPPPKLLPLLDPGAWQCIDTPAREWALVDWIPHRQATYLTGPGSAGKSLLTQLLCTCIALGLPFLGVETRQAVAIYITCEDDADELHRRQKSICEALGVSLSALSGKLHLVSLAGAIGNEMATFTPEGRMTIAENYRVVQATAAATGASFLVLDNVAHLFAGNENIRNQVAAFVGLLNQLAHEIDGSVLFLGHPNKAGDSFSGSTAWENQVRSRLFMEVPKAEDGSIADPDARVLSRGKANYARNGEQLAFRWHKGTFIRDEDLPEDTRGEIAEIIRANAENEAFLRCLDLRNDQERPVSESAASRTFAPKEFAAMPEAKGVKQRQLEAAMERLFRIGEIEIGLVCRTGRKDRFGVRRKCADPRADPALTGCADPALTPRPPAPSHTPYINITGAATRAAAPSREEERGPDLTRPIFTAEDDDDGHGNIPGWNDDWRAH